MVELLQDAKFLLHAFKLDQQRALPLAPKAADRIDLRYKSLSLQAKTKFHVDQLKIEIACLKMLTLQRYGRINEMEGELKYIQTLKVF